MAGKKKTTGGTGEKNGVELGVGYVTLTTEASKVYDEVEKEFGATEKAAEKTGKEAGKKYGTGFGDTVKKGLKAGGLAVGGAASAGILAGLHDAMTREDLQGSIKAQLGVTDEVAAEIAEGAGKAYASGWGESLEQVGADAAVLAQVIKDVGAGGEIDDLTVKATVMAEKFGQDVAGIANAAGNLVKTGMVDSLDEAFDVMAAGFQSNSKLSEDFLDTIDEYGVQFQALGLNAEDALGLMNQGLAAGARNGDLVADALKEFAILAQDSGSKTVAEGYELMGLKAEEMIKKVAEGGPAAKEALQQVLDSLRAMEDPVEQNTAGVALFGTKWEDLKGAMLGLDPSTATDALGDVSGAAGEMVANAKGFDQIIDGLARTLNESLGEALTPLLPQLEGLADVGLAFFRWLGENPAITGILLGIGAAIGVITAATWLWNAAQLASPAMWIFGLIMLGLVGLVAGIKWLIENWDTAMNFLEAAAVHTINGCIHAFNGLINMLNIAGKGLESILTMGGKLGDWGWGEIPLVDLHDVPGLAVGGTVTHGGTVMVGEQGPELLKLPAGASVIPLDHPAAGSGSGTNITIKQYNPLPERGSKSLQNAGQLIGASLV